MQQLHRSAASGKTKLVLDFGTFLQKIFLQYSTNDNGSSGGGDGDSSGKNGDYNVLDGKLDSINEHINRVLEITNVPVLPDRVLLDSIGTKLWNMCTRVMRRGGSGSGNGNGNGSKGDLRVLCAARAFSFFMIEAGTGRKGDDGSDDIRLLKVALTTARACLEFDQLDLGLGVLEKAAIREDALSTRNKGGDASDEAIYKYSTEYYILRIALSWRQGRIDVAEHMYSKIDAACVKREPTAAESLAGVLYDIGKSMLGRGEHEPAARWLQHSYETLCQHEIGRLSQDAGELRLSVLHGLVRANLPLQQEDSEAIVSNFLELLERDYGNRIPVILLTLDIISNASTPDCQRYYEKLCLLVRTVPVTESNFKIITRHIHRLRDWSSELASHALEQLLLQRLNLCSDIALLERAFVTYVWMKTSLAGLVDGLDPLTSLAEKLTELLGKPLSEEAAYASLILLWKKLNSAFGLKEYDSAEKWCLLAKNVIFENAGESNKSKLSRKLILCALKKNDTAKARQAFNEMPERSRSDSLTQYLMYRVALIEEDPELARDCLTALYNQGKGSETYILACVAEAQHIGNKYQAALVLQLLLDKVDKKELDGIHLPALLRCTARLLIAELSTTKLKESEIINQVCDVFGIASTQATKSHGHSSNPFSVSELDWFSKNSYNLAVQHCTNWDHCPIIDLYPLDLPHEQLSNISLRKLLCHFLAAILCMAQARMEPDVQVQKDHYLDSRIHIQSFRETFHTNSMSTHRDEKCRTDLLKKHSTLLAFDFEASIRLRQWQGLHEIIDESQSCADDKLYGIFSDIMLCADAPIEETTRVFQQITTQILRHRKPHDTTKLSRWIRCLFQLTLDTNVQVAESVLDQAYALARESHSQHQQLDRRPNSRPGSRSALVALPNYPEEELEWLSTTTFNRAVDFYLASDDGASRRWGQKALDLAGLMVGDRGMLYKVLKEKFAGLKWE
ncbi:hypothetical protein FQN53_000033 [Emmonsiellopsis sp. PD_33]|nr:hypothetical protein FQN53_000033 [Emmonsiellopsis sp. PD_33]